MIIFWNQIIYCLEVIEASLVTMKITFICAFLLLMYFSICYGNPQPLGNLKVQQKNPSFVHNRGIYVNIAKLPGIVCYYAKNGRWPDYPLRLRELVYRFARFIFSMSDESIRRYCRQINNAGTTRRPFFSLTTMRFTRDDRTTQRSTVFSTRTPSTTTTRFQTRTPSTSTTRQTTRTPSTTTTRQTTRFSSSTTRIPSTTRLITTSSSTVAPASGTGKY